MKNKIMLLLIFSFILVGCERNDLNTDNTNVYDANKNAYKIKNEVAEELENIKEEIDNSITNNDNTNDNTTSYYDENDNTINNSIIVISPISTFSTKILTSSSNRYNNIKIVSDRLNGYILNDGDEFSYNDVCGPYGESDGFLEAPILLSNGKEEMGFGGGVCQLSSTLYNAVKDLNVDITERHHHSAPVAYVPENEDATVSMQSDLDFKFVNNTGTNLRFETLYDPDNLTVNVYEE